MQKLGAEYLGVDEYFIKYWLWQPLQDSIKHNEL